MPEDGYSREACIDFDLSCGDLKRWADQRQAQTRMVALSAAERDAKPKKAVPVYRTLAEVLALDEETAETALAMSGIGADELDELTADYLSGYGRDDEDDE